MPKKEAVLVIEAPEVSALVHFLQDDVVVEISIDAEGVYLCVKDSHGKDSSSWDEYRYTAKRKTMNLSKDQPCPICGKKVCDKFVNAKLQKD